MHSRNLHLKWIHFSIILLTVSTAKKHGVCHDGAAPAVQSVIRKLSRCGRHAGKQPVWILLHPDLLPGAERKQSGSLDLLSSAWLFLSLHHIFDPPGCGGPAVRHRPPAEGHLPPHRGPLALWGGAVQDGWFSVLRQHVRQSVFPGLRGGGPLPGRGARGEIAEGPPRSLRPRHQLLSVGPGYRIHGASPRLPPNRGGGWRDRVLAAVQGEGFPQRPDLAGGGVHSAFPHHPVLLPAHHSQPSPGLQARAHPEAKGPAHHRRGAAHLRALLPALPREQSDVHPGLQPSRRLLSEPQRPEPGQPPHLLPHLFERRHGPAHLPVWGREISRHANSVVLQR